MFINTFSYVLNNYHVQARLFHDFPNFKRFDILREIAKFIDISKDFICFAFQETIAKQCRISARRLRDHLKIFHDLKLIELIKQGKSYLICPGEYFFQDLNNPKLGHKLANQDAKNDNNIPEKTSGVIPKLLPKTSGVSVQKQTNVRYIQDKTSGDSNKEVFNKSFINKNTHTVEISNNTQEADAMAQGNIISFYQKLCEIFPKVRQHNLPACLHFWKQHNLEAVGENILNHVTHELAHNPSWAKNEAYRYVPYLLRYLKEFRWVNFIEPVSNIKTHGESIMQNLYKNLEFNLKDYTHWVNLVGQEKTDNQIYKLFRQKNPELFNQIKARFALIQSDANNEETKIININKSANCEKSSGPKKIEEILGNI